MSTVVGLDGIVEKFFFNDINIYLIQLLIITFFITICYLVS